MIGAMMAGAQELRAKLVPWLPRGDTRRDLLKMKWEANTLVVSDIQSTHARLLLEPETEELANVLSVEIARAEARR